MAAQLIECLFRKTGEMQEPVDNGNEGAPQISHTRLIVIMGAVAVFGGIAGFALFSAKAGAGFLAGGALSFGNYFWMRHSLKKVFDHTEEDEKPTFLGSGYLMRYVAFASILAVIYLVDWELMVPLILGLASFGFAIVFEGIIRIIATFGKKRGI